MGAGAQPRVPGEWEEVSGVRAGAVGESPHGEGKGETGEGTPFTLGARASVHLDPKLWFNEAVLSVVK